MTTSATPPTDFVIRQTRTAPLDPAAHLWPSLGPYHVELAPQKMALPNGGQPRGLDVRACHDHRRMAVHLTWEDEKPDDNVGLSGFRDACALMFPALPGETPPFMMGGPGAPVILWQWKPDWEHPQDQEAHRLTRYPEYADFYNPSNDQRFANVGDRPRSGSANVLVAEGFGTLTRTEDPGLEVASRRVGTGWQVVFRHDIPSQYPPLGGDQRTPMNFAVWNGSADERGARKSLSYRWHAAELREGPTLPAWMFPVGVAGAGVSAAALALFIRRKNRLAIERNQTPREGK